ncbi:hypothetical protein E2C01_034314 [Portunus trituberculatus]|uniref:Uncharacterized protein n=1 Tax=Portunus trituberculatus TaxID=210409 RepID=A0A5B7F6N3_PORTR|nr:hypothetical protein [Portunus trituberculatus]
MHHEEVKRDRLTIGKDTYILIDIILNATNKEFLHRHTSLRFANLISRHGAFRIHRAPVNLVWPVLLCLVHHVSLGERHEAKPTRSLCFGVLHHNNVNNLAILLEVCLEAVVGGATHEFNTKLKTSEKKKVNAPKTPDHVP